ncbi:80 kD MCM3-associated protein, putative [Pediculus humanus corporis]|uniref:80 kD MCM3-associated protein, putative n=1 Tax=Pediculus humanus subsp. corporis TaxID=121224 RepID=E0VDX8_PEDHC|nr:80 kD MCM3-associated protein, putative [Pediculus humanus corporis]EEB11584.1 80 kD MCM3-associated protein, putative [Pediculus humanus corporis]
MDDFCIRGTCQTMCPLREAQQREKEKLLHKLEIKLGTECHSTPKFDIDKIVKCFNRSAAGKETSDPCNLRPFPVLLKTIQYLYKKVFPLHKEKPIFVYDFMFDRFRSSLLVCYNDCECGDLNNRWEIESSYLLFNLGNVESLMQGVRNDILKTNKIYKICLKLSFHWYLKNFIRVFKLLVDLPPLLLCVICTLIPEIRKYALQSMNFAFSSQNSAYPLDHLCDLLLFESVGHAEKECSHYNIKINDGKVKFIKKDFDLNVKCGKGVRLKWIDKKLNDVDIEHLLCYGND